MLTNNTAYKYEIPYNGSFMITQSAALNKFMVVTHKCLQPINPVG